MRSVRPSTPWAHLHPHKHAQRRNCCARHDRNFIDQTESDETKRNETRPEKKHARTHQKEDTKKHIIHTDSTTTAAAVGGGGGGGTRGVGKKRVHIFMCGT